MKRIKSIISEMLFITALILFSAGLSYAEGGSITGKVNFEGTAPSPKPINFGAERQCAIVHGDKAPVEESLIVNSNNTVKWALVYVKEGVTGEYPAPAQPVEVDQNGCIFEPHVSAAMVGQTINFKNGDDLLHNVRANSKINKMFNIAQPVKGMTTAKKFDQPEIGIQLRCDVHFWMAAYLHVLNHPFFATTGDDGSFTIKDLPAGSYTIETWHETLGTQSQSVTLTDGESKPIDFILKKA